MVNRVEIFKIDNGWIVEYSLKKKVEGKEREFDYEYKKIYFDEIGTALEKVSELYDTYEAAVVDY